MLAVRCPSSFISAGRLTPARNMLVAYVCRFPDYAACWRASRYSGALEPRRSGIVLARGLALWESDKPTLHLLPLPAAMAAPDPDAANAAAVLERFSAALRLLDLYRQQLQLLVPDDQGCPFGATQLLVGVR